MCASSRGSPEGTLPLFPFLLAGMYRCQRAFLDHMLEAWKIRGAEPPQHFGYLLKKEVLPILFKPLLFLVFLF